MARTLSGITLVGSPTTIADKMEELIETAGTDGFNIADPLPLSSFPDIVEYVVPEAP